MKFRLFYNIMLSALALSHVNVSRSESLSQRDDLITIQVLNKKKLPFDKLREATLVRAARIAQERGFTHFEFVDSLEKPITGSVERQGNMVKDVYGHASITDLPTLLSPTPIRDKSLIFFKLCNDYRSSCKGLSAQDVLKNLHE